MSNACSHACPEWCNREHRPGSNPRRQTHVNRLEVGDLRLDSYAGPTWAGNFTDEGFVSLEVAGLIHGRWGYLAASDARELGRRLLDMADAAEAAQALADARKIGLPA